MNPEREQPVWTPPARAPDAASVDGPGREDGLGSEAQPLEPRVRQEMESRFGQDFSSVRAHAGGHADEAARRFGARAFALGEDVYFAAERLAPGTAPGAGLLEHELGHVVEQRRGAPRGVYRSPEGEPEPEAEPVGPLTQRALPLVTLSGFDFNGAALKPEHGPQVADVAEKLVMLLGKTPGGRITVTGHTDLVGGEDANLRLGLRRAEAVRDALAKDGVPAGAMTAGSEGRQSPAVQDAGARAAQPACRRAIRTRAGGPGVDAARGRASDADAALGSSGQGRPHGTGPVAGASGAAAPAYPRPRAGEAEARGAGGPVEARNSRRPRQGAHGHSRGQGPDRQGKGRTASPARPAVDG